MTPDELEALANEVQRQGYINARVLPDGTVAALGELMYTRAIFLDCDRCGYGTRFCFADKQLANVRFAELTSADDVPEGFIARR